MLSMVWLVGWLEVVNYIDRCSLYVGVPGSARPNRASQSISQVCPNTITFCPFASGVISAFPSCNLERLRRAATKVSPTLPHGPIRV